jgi:hypothetical protein
MSSAIETTLFGVKEGLKSQVQPEVPSKLNFSQRECRETLDPRYQSDLFFERLESPAPGLLPINSGGIKQSGTNLNQNKIQHGYLTRAYS